MFGISAFEPLKHLVGFFAQTVDGGDLERATHRMVVDECLQGSVSRGVITLRLLGQSQCVILPESFRLQLCIMQRGRGVPT